jgi:hypothetical protein
MEARAEVQVGIFDLFRKTPKNTTTSAASAPAVDKKIAGPAKVVADKRAQTYDRIEAIQALVDMKSPDAAAALLRRFTFTIDPSITDADEKEVAFRGIIERGGQIIIGFFVLFFLGFLPRGRQKPGQIPMRRRRRKRFVRERRIARIIGIGPDEVITKGINKLGANRGGSSHRSRR